MTTRDRASDSAGDHARGATLRLDMERALAVLSDGGARGDRAVLP